MSELLFTNESTTNLKERLVDILSKNKENLKNFKIAVSHIKTTGYFSLNNRIPENVKLKILIGIDQNYNLSKELNKLDYDEETESAIRSFIKRLKNGTIEIAFLKNKTLNSRFYILYENIEENKGKSHNVLIGSATKTDQNLIPIGNSQFEFLTELNEYKEVRYANEEFEKLWKESDILNPENEIKELSKNVSTEINPTPYEIYIKFLIENLGYLVENDSLDDLSIMGTKVIKYQVDAAKEGLKMLNTHNGFFLADVVGTGKTIIALMICKAFIKENGNTTKILIVLPPATQNTWEDWIEKSNLKDYCQITTKDQLGKHINNEGDKERPERFDLVIVDEAHNFRNKTTNRYENLKTIMKSERKFNGNLPGRKKIVLMTATPFNNKVEEIKNLIYLFQDPIQNTIINKNLEKYFEYKTFLIKKHAKNKDKMKKITNSLKSEIIEEITVRRVRSELKKNYEEDIEKLNFPSVDDPEILNYDLDDYLESLYKETIKFIDEEFKYTIYNTDKYKDNDVESPNKYNALSGLIRTLLFKRVESSYAAFKETLNKIKENYENKIVTINSFIEEEEEEFIDSSKENKIKQLYENNLRYRQDFDTDLEGLNNLLKQWEENKKDPKFKKLKELLNTENNQKIVVFSEYKSTIDYIGVKLKNERIHLNRILKVDSSNLKNSLIDIRANFDNGTKPGDKRDEFDLLLTTDVLSEGVNLHRAGILINYDTPWNPIRIVQRVGRICRLGAKENKLKNYIFYPSDKGEEIINLINKGLMKIEISNSIYGSDHKILSPDEIVQEFGKKFFEEEESNQKSDSLKELRDFKKEWPDDYDRIKAMPNKIRCMRENSIDGKTSTIAFLKCRNSFQSYKIDKDNKLKKLSFKEAAALFKAEIDEEGAKKVTANHFENMKKCLEEFKNLDDSQIKTYGAEVILSESFEQIGSFEEDETEANTNDQFEGEAVQAQTNRLGQIPLPL